VPPVRVVEMPGELPDDMNTATLKEDWRMFRKGDKKGYKAALEGIQQKTLVHGQRTLMTEFTLAAGSILPLHDHHCEQTGYLVRGKLRLFVGPDEYNARAGDSWCVEGDVVHGAEALEDSVAVEVFSPPRKDFLPEPDRSPPYEKRGYNRYE